MSPMTPVSPELVRTISEGRCVLFIGSGLSKHTHGLATWGEFVHSIRKRMGQVHGIRDDTDEAAVASYPLEYLEYLKANYRVQYAGAVEEELLVRPEDDVQRAHSVIATLPWAAIVTTNLDNLLETALARESIRPAVVDTEESLSRIGLAKGPLLIKMHGSAGTHESQVLTRFEYIEFAQKRQATKAIVLTLFTQFPVLVIGAGLTDPNFLAIYGLASSALHEFRRRTFYVGHGTPGFVKQIWTARLMDFIDVPHGELTAWLENLAREVRVHRNESLARRASASIDRYLKEAALVSLGPDLADYRALQQRYLDQVHIPDYGWFTVPWDSTLYSRLKATLARAVGTLPSNDRQEWSLLYVAPGPHAPVFAEPMPNELQRPIGGLRDIYLLDILPSVVGAAKTNVRERIEPAARLTAIIADITGGIGDALCNFLYNLLEQHSELSSVLEQLTPAADIVEAVFPSETVSQVAASIANSARTPEGPVAATVSYSEMVASFSLTAPVMAFRAVLYKRFADAGQEALEEVMNAVTAVWRLCNDRLFLVHLDVLARLTKPGGIVIVAMDVRKRFDENGVAPIDSFSWTDPPIPAGVPLLRKPAVDTEFDWRDHDHGFPIHIAGIPVRDFLSHDHLVRVLGYTRTP